MENKSPTFKHGRLQKPSCTASWASQWQLMCAPRLPSRGWHVPGTAALAVQLSKAVASLFLPCTLFPPPLAGEKLHKGLFAICRRDPPPVGGRFLTELMFAPGPQLCDKITGCPSLAWTEEPGRWVARSQTRLSDSRFPLLSPIPCSKLSI